INAASDEWLRGIEKIARKFEILLIVDDIQAGCGRTGTFFSFEKAGIKPDIVCLSKSIGGYGLPMAITLFNEELDIWSPGEHNGTFRGNNLAFIAAAEAINFWKDDACSKQIEKNATLLKELATDIVERYPEIKGTARGRGLMQGVACEVDGLAEKICEKSFEQGLLMETSGPKDEVFKFLPPLMIDEAGIREGFTIIENSIQQILDK